VSTFTDGAPPSVAPEPDHSRPGLDHHEQAGANGHSAADSEPTEGSTWLSEELARRVAAGKAGSGGRHARRGNERPVPVTGNAPRHAAPGSAPAVGGPALSARPPRRDDLFAESRRSGPHDAADPAVSAPRPDPWTGPLDAADPAVSAPRPDPWTGPRPAERGPDTPPGGQGRPRPARPRQPGVPERLGIGLPSRPAPPFGAAAARLLSPPPTPPRPSPPVPEPPAVAPPMSAPTPVDVAPAQAGPPAPAQAGPPAAAAPVNGHGAGFSAVDATTHNLPAHLPDPGPPTAPVHDDDPGDGSEDQILWSAADLPPSSVPEQRASEPDDDPDASLKRVRVVLAERKGVARPVRTVVDIQEGTAVGELLRTNLIGSQLRVALRFAAFAALTLGALPLLFAVFPAIGEIEIPYLRLRLPWLLLGFLVYPFLLGLGWWHTRCAERVEQNFADHVQE
jgi:hypothetical protein